MWENVLKRLKGARENVIQKTLSMYIFHVSLILKDKKIHMQLKLIEKNKMNEIL